MLRLGALVVSLAPALPRSLTRELRNEEEFLSLPDDVCVCVCVSVCVCVVFLSP
jgi:hypothetical protein